MICTQKGDARDKTYTSVLSDTISWIVLTSYNSDIYNDVLNTPIWLVLYYTIALQYYATLYDFITTTTCTVNETNLKTVL